MATYQSTQVTGFASTTSIVITKPVDLAVGDLLIAGLACVQNASFTFTPPAGWTALYNAYYIAGSTGMTYGILYKIADSGDVAASNFTFTGSNVTAGFLTRVTDFGMFDDYSLTASVNPTTPASFASSIAPTKSNSLALFYVLGGLNGTATAPTVSSQAIATDNPTWTSRASTTVAVGASYIFNLVTAPRTQSTAWGNASFSFTAPATSDFVTILLSIAPRVDGSGTVDTGEVHLINQPFLQSGVIDVIGSEPESDSMNTPVWSNRTKPSTVWTNPDK